MRSRCGLLGPVVYHCMRLADLHAGLDVHPVLCAARFQCRHLGQLAGACRPAQGRGGVGPVLVRWHAGVGAGGVSAPVLADGSGFGRDWWHWFGAGLYLPRVHADQVVPGPARHGHRYGHHGFWWRRHDRVAAGGGPDEVLCDADRCRGDADLCGHGPGLFRVHDGRCLWLPCARDRLEACGLDASCSRCCEHHDHPAPRAFQQGLGHSAVLADLDGAVHERECWYWRDRHGLAHAAGSVWRLPDRCGQEVW